jgi:hypothetical protein
VITRLAVDLDFSKSLKLSSLMFAGKRVHEDIFRYRLTSAEFSARVRTAAHRTASKNAQATNKIASIGRRCVATGIATLAPVHNVRYAAMHIGHFGSRTSSAPEPTHPLVPRHHLCWGCRPVWTLQQFIIPGFLSPCEEEAGFRSLLHIMENMPHP